MKTGKQYFLEIMQLFYIQVGVIDHLISEKHQALTYVKRGNCNEAGRSHYYIYFCYVHG